MSEEKKEEKMDRRKYIKYVGAGAVVAAAAAAIGYGVSELTKPPPPKPTTIVTTVPTTKVITTATTAKKPKLTILERTWFADAIGRWFEAKVYEWAQKRGVEVEISTLPVADLNKKQIALVEAGTPPDIAFPALVGMFAEDPKTRVLEPLDDVINEIGRDDIFENILKMCSVDGKVYGLPVGPDNNILHYRKDLFEEVGYKQPPDTWDEMYEAMKKIKEKHPSIYPFGLCMGSGGEDDIYNFETLWWCFGGKSITERSSKGLHFNEQATIDTYNYVLKCWNDNLIPPDALTWLGPGNNNAYLSGKSAVVINAPSIYYQIMQQQNFDLAKATLCIPPPKGPKGDRLISCGIFAEPIAIFKESENVDLAKDLIIHVFKDKDAYMKACVLASYGFMAPIFKSVVENVKKQGPWWEMLMDAIPLVWFNYPLGEPSRAMEEIGVKGMYGRVYSRIIVDKIPVEQAVKEAHEQMLEIFRRVYGS
jgi:ABC-type glycerol-3-phosphate transport system substrate-binding protein